MENRPLSSSSTFAAHSAGAHRASRYSASVAAGHSWRPVCTAWRARSRACSSPSQSCALVSESIHRTSPSRSARWINSSSEVAGLTASACQANATFATSS